MRLFLYLTLSLLLHGLLLATRSESARQMATVPRVDVELTQAKEPAPDEPVPPMPDELSSIPEVPATAPAPAPPPPPPPPLVPEKAPSKRDVTVVRQAQSKLMEHLLYPPQAVAQGLEGEVILLLTLDANGRVTAASVARSSGHAILDEAAMDAARSLGPLRSATREILLPVEFTLD